MIARAHEALDKIEAAHKEEVARLSKGLAQQTTKARDTQIRLELANKKARALEKERNEALAKLNDREQKIVDAHADTESRIATLEAEKEIMALRDREARDELDKLRMTK